MQKPTENTNLSNLSNAMKDTPDSNACVAFGTFVRDRRKALGKTARAVAVDIGMQASNYCKLEYGALQPPSDPRKLARVADALDLPFNEPLTHDFFDLAAKALHTIPVDVAEIISRDEAMPMVLRTLGCRKLTPDDVEKIIALVREKE